MPFTRRDLLSIAIAAAVPGVPAAVCAQAADTDRTNESSERLPYSEMEEAKAWIEKTAAETGLPRDFIADTLDLASYSPRVEQLMTPKKRWAGSASGTYRANWRGYRRRMVDAARVKRGLAFLEENERGFDEAEDRFGVPRDIVAAIIGIETVYGRSQGSFRVLDTLCTLSFDYKRRAEYFRKELAQFLLLVREQNLEPLSVLGSFAGAIGMGQFMPSSIRKLAVDFDGDGRIDLLHSPADAIGSVANYLTANGWVRGLPPYLGCKAGPSADLSAAKGGVSVSTTLAEVLKAGFVPDFEVDLPEDEPLMVVDLPTADEDGNLLTEYRLGTRNFQAILTYNRSYFYASAVSDLALEIEAASMKAAESRMMSEASAS